MTQNSFKPISIQHRHLSLARKSIAINIKKTPNNGDTQTAFHTYGVLKEGDKITFFYDGQALYTVKYSEIKKNEAFVNPENGFILRLTHIVGGSFVKDFGKTLPVTIRMRFLTKIAIRMAVVQTCKSIMFAYGNQVLNL